MLRILFVVTAMVVVFGLLYSPLATAAVPATVMMAEQNGSGQSGTAALHPMGLQTHVIINVTPGPAGVAQPVHIHAGQCPNVGGVVHSLADVVNGQSSTVVNASIGELTTGGLAINVHKSVAEIAIATSCGNIPLQ